MKSRVRHRACDPRVGSLLQVVIMGQPCHFRFGPLDLLIGDGECARPGAENRLVGGRSNRRLPVIEPRAHARWPLSRGKPHTSRRTQPNRQAGPPPPATALSRRLNGTLSSATRPSPSISSHPPFEPDQYRQPSPPAPTSPIKKPLATCRQQAAQLPQRGQGGGQQEQQHPGQGVWIKECCRRCGRWKSS